jgi:hypothetical protein
MPRHSNLNLRSLLNLLPCPRVLSTGKGFYRVPQRATLGFGAKDPELRCVARRLQAGAREAGVELVAEERNPSAADFFARITASWKSAPAVHPEGYALRIGPDGVLIECREIGGLRAAVATLRQLLREFGRRLPCLTIEDWPDFPRRGVMLDISRGRVPRLETLLALVDHLADFKINEFQLYIEHTFAYRHYKAVWRGWGAMTGREVRRLNARCRDLGIDLVPNQNSFGHLRQWLEYPPLKKLAEAPEPYESEDGTFLRFPSTLAPKHPGTLPFLRRLYDELLPNFSSHYFNVGCDETWDLGRGQSKALCESQGEGRVYGEFLKRIRREVAGRGRQMMFWGDMVLQHPELLQELPKDVIALNWGYAADHPFAREAAVFAGAGVRFYVCPGTSTWMTLVGKHDNALANLRSAAAAGRQHGAAGYLVTDWGDGGHPQPLAVSYLPYLAGASLGWCAKSFTEQKLVSVLSRDIFCDPSGRLAKAALALGLAYRKFNYTEANSTPFGTTIGAPLPGVRELWCRNGLNNYRHIPQKSIVAALNETQAQLERIQRSRPSTALGRILGTELELAGRMAVQSCRFMLWQHALAAGKSLLAQRLARRGIRELRKLESDFSAYWPVRNKGTTEKCSPFLRWRARSYQAGTV